MKGCVYASWETQNLHTIYLIYMYVNIPKGDVKWPLCLTDALETHLGEWKGMPLKQRKHKIVTFLPLQQKMISWYYRMGEVERRERK